MVFDRAIDLMHNDVKQCIRGSNVHCGSCSHEEANMATCFPEAGNLNGSYALLTCVLMWLGRRVGARAILELSDGSNKTLDPLLLLFLPLMT